MRKFTYDTTPHIYIIGILIAIIVPIILFVSSDYYIKKEYVDFKRLEFSEPLTIKNDENPTKANSIYLKNGIELRVQREIFDKLTIGDIIYKKGNSDFVYFNTKSGILKDDYNAFKREKYLNSLK